MLTKLEKQDQHVQVRHEKISSISGLRYWTRWNLQSTIGRYGLQ
jgi:hypothetical protein